MYDFEKSVTIQSPAQEPPGSETGHVWRGMRHVLRTREQEDNSTVTYAMTKKTTRRRIERIQHKHAHDPTCSVLLSARCLLSAICDLHENHR